MVGLDSGATVEGRGSVVGRPVETKEEVVEGRLVLGGTVI